MYDDVTGKGVMHARILLVHWKTDDLSVPGVPACNQLMSGINIIQKTE